MIKWVKIKSDKDLPKHSKPVITCEIISIQWKSFHVMQYHKNEWWFPGSDVRFRGEVFCWGEINHPIISDRRRIPSF